MGKYSSRKKHVQNCQCVRENNTEQQLHNVSQFLNVVKSPRILRFCFLLVTSLNYKSHESPFSPPFPHWLYWFYRINAIWIQFEDLLEPRSHRMPHTFPYKVILPINPHLHPSPILKSHHDTTLTENPTDRLVHVQFNLFRVGLYRSFLCCQSLENGPMDSYDENTKFEVCHNILS